MTFPFGQDVLVICKPIDLSPPDLCIIFPANVPVCSISTFLPPSLFELAMQLMGQASAALAPLQPIFNIIEVIVALKECIDAIPEALGPPPNIEPLTACARNLTEQLASLLKLIPQLSIPILIATLLDTIIAVLNGTLDEVLAVIRLANRIVNAKLIPGDGLLDLIICTEQTVVNQMINLENAFGAVNSVIEIINVLGEPIGLELPSFEGIFGDDPAAALDPIQKSLDTVKVFRANIVLPASC